MCHNILWSVTCLVLSYFGAVFYNRHDFGKKGGVEGKMFVLSLSTNFSETFPILRIIQQT